METKIGKKCPPEGISGSCRIHRFHSLTRHFNRLVSEKGFRPLTPQRFNKHGESVLLHKLLKRCFTSEHSCFLFGNFQHIHTGQNAHHSLRACGQIIFPHQIPVIDIERNQFPFLMCHPERLLCGFPFRMSRQGA